MCFLLFAFVSLSVLSQKFCYIVLTIDITQQLKDERMNRIRAKDVPYMSKDTEQDKKTRRKK